MRRVCEVVLEPVGEGEAGTPTGVEAAGGDFLPVAAASPLKIFFSLELSGRCQLGDQP